MDIITNKHWRQFKYEYEVPEEELEYYDHLTEDFGRYDGWISYRDRWYHVSDFMRLDDRSPFNNNWHGYHSDSFFSGVLIELSDCGEMYRIGTYIS